MHCLLTHNFRQATCLRHGKFSTSALFNFYYFFLFSGVGFLGIEKDFLVVWGTQNSSHAGWGGRVEMNND